MTDRKRGRSRKRSRRKKGGKVSAAIVFLLIVAVCMLAVFLKVSRGNSLVPEEETTAGVIIETETFPEENGSV